MKLHTQILLAIAAGCALGIAIHPLPLDSRWPEWLFLPGTLFVRALKMIVVPLVFVSIVRALLPEPGKLPLAGNTHMGVRTLATYALTSLLAILTGLFFVNILQPGQGLQIELATEIPAMPTHTVTGLVERLVPTNPAAALANADMIGIIVFAALFGLAVKVQPTDQRERIAALFVAGSGAIQTMTGWILAMAPVGVFSLVAKTTSSYGPDVFRPVAGYMATVVLALGVHAALTMPLLLFLFAGGNVRSHFRRMREALLTAFATASSAATLPLTMRALEGDENVHTETAQFVLPLGATVNMDGTALYECVAALFIAQAYGLDLSILDQAVVVGTALAASIGAAGVPMAGLVMMGIILTAVGLPLEGVGLIVAVDRVLDMMRTAVNVWGDSCCARIVSWQQGFRFDKS